MLQSVDAKRKNSATAWSGIKLAKQRFALVRWTIWIASATASLVLLFSCCINLSLFLFISSFFRDYTSRSLITFTMDSRMYTLTIPLAFQKWKSVRLIVGNNRYLYICNFPMIFWFVFWICFFDFISLISNVLKY